MHLQIRIGVHAQENNAWPGRPAGAALIQELNHADYYYSTVGMMLHVIDEDVKWNVRRWSLVIEMPATVSQ